jgi:hypothetical protein
MQTSRLVEALADDLRKAASLGSDEAEALADRLIEALESPLQLRLMGAMTEAANELTHQLPDGHVEVRLAGSDLELVYVASSDPTPPGEDSLDARITLRLHSRLKGLVEAAAAAQSASVNTYILRELSKSATRRTVGSRLTGFAKS